jgi:glycosyltransferase involved in cell wall biosynthesis
MDYLIVLPIINNEHLVDSCIASIPDKSKLLLIDNSPTGFGKKYGVETIYHPENLGVGASWNLGLKRGHEYTVLLSASIQIKGNLEEWLSQANDWGVYSAESWHLVGIRKATVDKIGLVDEHFYPAYYEDNDYHRRMILEGCEFVKIPIECISAGNAMSIKNGVMPNFPECERYYAKKWGGLPTKETFNVPFDTDKWMYSKFYDKEFKDLKPESLLEIGVWKGGSLKMWEEYFPQAKIYGIESNPSFKTSENIFIGLQSDEKFLQEIIAKIGVPDIIIDDGSHKVSDQQKSFEVLFPLMKSGGIYVIEDLCTSYWTDHELNFVDGKRTTEYLLDLIMESGRDPHHKDFLTDVLSVKFYRSIAFITKR